MSVALAVVGVSLGALGAELPVRTIVESGDPLPGPPGLVVPTDSAVETGPFRFVPATDGENVVFQTLLPNGLQGTYRTHGDESMGVVVDPFGSTSFADGSGAFALPTTFSHKRIAGDTVFFTGLPTGSLFEPVLFTHTPAGITAFADAESVTGDATGSSAPRISLATWTDTGALVVARPAGTTLASIVRVAPGGMVTTILDSGDDPVGLGTLRITYSVFTSAAGSGENYVVFTTQGLIARVGGVWSLIDDDIGASYSTLDMDGDRVAFRDHDLVGWWSPDEGLTTLDLGTVLPDGATINGYARFGGVALSGDWLAFIADTDLGHFAYLLDLGSGDLTRLFEIGSDTLDGRVLTYAEFSVESFSGNLLAFTASFDDGTSGIYTLRVPAPGTLALLGVGVVAVRRRRR